MPVHRAADIEEEQQLHGIAPLRPVANIEIALIGGLANGAVEIELLGRTGAGEAPQAAQGDPHVACAELDAVIEIPEFALVPHLHRAKIPVAVLADADAFGVVAIGAER